MKLEQRKLKTITEETQAIANERMQLENANRKYEKKLKELRNVHKQVCKIGILLPKLFWPTTRKKCSSDREKPLKF